MSSSTHPLSRRQWLARSASLGFALAVPGARLAFAGEASSGSGSGNERLVVVMLRGAMDGLAAVPAAGDPAWGSLRPSAAQDASRYGAPLRLDDTFALHPKLATLQGWFTQGDLLVLHAVASPYRDRSHFDGQQLLESGGERPFELQTGWLGRALQASGRGGVAITASMPLALRGASQATSWAPTHQRPLDADLLSRLHELYEHDESMAGTFRLAAAQHGETQGMAMGAQTPGVNGFAALAQNAGRMLAKPDGPSVAWLESIGWDTHTGQSARLVRQFEPLDQGLAALKDALGERWSDTVVVVMTEFSRSATINGSGGTDHGTAGVAFIAGGRVAGGKVRADWPGLGRSQLLDARDLRPTADLRTFIKPVLERQLKLPNAVLDKEVFPGSPRSSAGLWKA